MRYILWSSNTIRILPFIHKGHRLVSIRWLCIISWLTGVLICMCNKKFYHVSEHEAYHKSRDQKPIHSNSHGKIDKNWMSFISNLNVLFVTDVIAAHLNNQRIKYTFSAWSIVSFGLIYSDVLGLISRQISVVSVVRGQSLESIHIIIWFIFNIVIDICSLSLVIS